MVSSPVAFCLEDLPEKKEISTIDDLNSVLNFLNISTKLKKPRCELIESLDNLCEEVPFLHQFSERIARLKAEEEKVKFYKGREDECDRLEVTLANLKTQLSEFEALDKMDISRLEDELALLNQNFNDVQFETINLGILKKIQAFIRGEAVEGDVINSLSYVKRLEGFDLLIEKHDLLREIESCDETGVFRLIALNDCTKVDDICLLIGGDRLETLELLYSLQGADVITFDNFTGTVRLKK